MKGVGNDNMIAQATHAVLCFELILVFLFTPFSKDVSTGRKYQTTVYSAVFEETFNIVMVDFRTSGVTSSVSVAFQPIALARVSRHGGRES